jgi:twitching motility protein PilT
MNFEPLLKFGVDQGASAIHLQAETTPQLRIGGLIRNVQGALLKGDELRAFIESIAPKSVAEDLDRSIDQGASFSASTAVGRFRCTTYSHVGGPGVVLRVIPATNRSLEELNLPKVVRDIALASRGLILVVGPTGSGKTTTVNAMIDLINASAYQKVVTIEAPVEYVHANKKAMVTQMEVGQNASSFEQGLGMALQQDADVIVVGDMRDGEVVRLALGAAESGRKVLAAVTAVNSIQALTRLVALVPRDDREFVVAQLATALEASVALRLANTRDGKPRPAVEVLRNSAQTAKAIQDGKFKDLSFFIEGRQGGMQSFDQHLLEMHQSGAISGTETMRLASNPEAVGAGLRTIRQGSPAPERAPTVAVDSGPELLP